jgi:hypothetical protein
MREMLDLLKSGEKEDFLAVFLVFPLFLLMTILILAVVK